MKEKNWYAIYTKPRWEKKVSKLLTDRNVVTYCPLNRVKRKWSDRIKTVLVPLLPSYLFVYINTAERQTIRETPGVINFVYIEGRPAIVKDYEVVRIQRFLNEFENVELTAFHPRKNQRVMINQGLLVEEEGRVIDLRNNKVEVAIESLNYSLVALFDKSKLINH
ncbi:UpxY family transcription antiterminator [Niabella beijingensis]|uniref:UpxY family transcription antiterminator n=1 Tax=Niabella beijingensis TaxID=2872700 RepID=UPI001CBFE9D1|nr:UpxY family transcription antiterminator [Niabella beijingensis]MBZ4189984.1 UpxY family transcription antiterminator [Niabella beijingensis]